LVHVHRRGDRLIVVPMPKDERPRARELAATVLALVRAHIGLPRGALTEAWSQVAIAPSEVQLARGLCKLALDTCEFDEGSAIDPVDLRLEVFVRAAATRKNGHGDLDRAAVLGEVALARKVEAEALEEALFADLPSAHLLRKTDLPSPDGLLARHALASHQAVLLRAVRVRAHVHCAESGGYRTLFRTLKFRRLLCTVEKLERGAGYAIDIDGPFNLFEQTTKYGLQLALALPAIMACDTWDIAAGIRWGKDRRPLRYHLRCGTDSTVDARSPAASLDETSTLLTELGQLGSNWQVSPADEILVLPGIGVCVPDLAFVHRKSGQRVFLEVLGFWSRAAVWKRIEMVEAGLPHPMVFAVSKHLRVSEEVLSDEPNAALYVYARTMNARAVLERVEAVSTGKPIKGR
jgi:predicted nuclease of restriction endonuclease-like RecB superfamily